MTPRELEKQHWLRVLRADAERLVAKAARAGIVLTIEQVSLQPPAMGNYETQVSVRLAREPATNRDEVPHA